MAIFQNFSSRFCSSIWTISFNGSLRTLRRSSSSRRLNAYLRFGRGWSRIGHVKTMIRQDTPDLGGAVLTLCLDARRSFLHTTRTPTISPAVFPVTISRGATRHKINFHTRLYAERALHTCYMSPSSPQIGRFSTGAVLSLKLVLIYAVSARRPLLRTKGTPRPNEAFQKRFGATHNDNRIELCALNFKSQNIHEACRPGL